MTTFFTADLHFGHERIIQLCKRPFSSVHEMHDILVRNWNSKVDAHDTVYILGDFSFNPVLTTEMVAKLKGHKQFIRGNHDRFVTTCGPIADVKKIKIGDVYIWLSHYPHLEWPGSFRGSWHLYGHCHGNLPDNPNMKALDVGVDSHGFFPISFEEVQELMRKKTAHSIFDNFDV